MTLAPRTVPAETFTVIHGGAEIDERLAAELLEAVSAWAAEPGPVAGPSPGPVAGPRPRPGPMAGPSPGPVAGPRPRPEPGPARVVEVWGPPWKRLLAGCLATAAAAGGPLLVPPLPAADDLVAGLRDLGVAVRFRQGRQSAVDDAELRAVSQGWPVRYL